MEKYCKTLYKRITMRKLLFIMSLFVYLSINAIETIKVACVGNSITYGIGVKDREKNSYPALLQRMLGDEYIVGSFGKPGATLLNRGHRPYTEQKEYNDALAFNADIIIIHLGVNDTDPRDWPDFRDDFIKDYISLIDSFKSVNSDARIIIAGITPIWDRHPRFLSGTKVWQDEIRDKIHVVADICDVEFIDFYSVLHNYPFMFPDAIHPNEEGASILAKTVYSAITGNYGGLKMPEIYSDNMVLQRDVPLKLSGTSNANDHIIVEIDGNKYETVTDNRGCWNIVIEPLSAKRNITMLVSNGYKNIVFKNVAVGEVWLCSGQSNMEFMLKNSVNAKEELKKSANSNIRLFDMKPRWKTDAVEWPESALDSVNHLEYYRKTTWKECNPETVKDFSAVAYYFGKTLQDSLDVPVGLICNAVGGSTTESWIDRNTLENKFPFILREWKNNDFIQKWARDRASLNIKKSESIFQRHPYEPCYLFEAGIIPLQQFPIKGAIWYQGESNAHNAEAHENLFKLLVNSWRNNWGNNYMPFYYVQLSSLNRPSWPWFRDSQRRLMYEIPNTGMVVSSDCGDSIDVHPRNKRPIGERLARWALSDTYKYNLLPTGPLFKKAIVTGNNSVTVSFDYSEGLCASNNNGKVIGFELAEYDGLYYAAETEIHNNIVILHSSKLKNPKYVRYGWQPFTKANLVNVNGLPTSTFKAKIDDLTIPNHPIPHGVSAPFAGVINDWIIVAGGCNFPDIPAAEGGKKVYYSEIYAINMKEKSKGWKLIGRLPNSAAYGATVSIGDNLYFIGGENMEGKLNSVYKVSMKSEACKVDLETLPSIPECITNLSGTAIGQDIYITGGITDTNKNSVYRISTQSSSEWEKLLSYPGNKRIQSILLANGKNELYLIGGFQSPSKKKEGVFSDDILCYNIEKRSWKRLIELPFDENGEKRCLIGGSGIAHNDMLILTGGVNYKIFNNAINGKAPNDYLKKPVEWYKFNDDILFFNLRNKTWNIVKDVNGMAKAGGILLEYKNSLYMICGETKPGIRSSEVITIPLSRIEQ